MVICESGFIDADLSVSGFLVLCLDMCSSQSPRTPSQRACLKWSNICLLFYSNLDLSRNIPSRPKETS